MKHNKTVKRRALKVNYRWMLILFTFIFSISEAMAQEVVLATGGLASGSGGSVSYSVGQPLYTAHTGTNGSVAQGVQQPYEISQISGLITANDIKLSVSAYPNPTSDYLNLDIKDYDLSDMNFQLYDLQGKLLQSETITGNQTSIVMSNLVPSTYFIKVIQSNKEIIAFKIIKK